MKKLVTTLGELTLEQAGSILPHEHIFVDLRPLDKQDYESIRTEEVVRLMAAELEAARKAGIGVIVECTPVGVGRRADVLKAVSAAADFPVVIPTGVYREPWIPQWVHAAAGTFLSEWMYGELDRGVEKTGIRADFIKLSAGDEGLTRCETKVLRAAVESAKPFDALIGSHTIKGSVVRKQLDILEEEGYSSQRFVWIHAQAEPDFSIHLEMAERGAWIEYDAIGWGDDRPFIDLIIRMLEAGYEKQILLSHDFGWYDPSKTGGGEPKPFNYITGTFLPKLRTAGIDDKTIHMLTCENPYRAFARNIIAK